MHAAAAATSTAGERKIDSQHFKAIAATKEAFLWYKKDLGVSLSLLTSKHG